MINQVQLEVTVLVLLLVMAVAITLLTLVAIFYTLRSYLYGPPPLTARRCNNLTSMLTPLDVSPATCLAAEDVDPAWQINVPVELPTPYNIPLANPELEEKSLSLCPYYELSLDDLRWHCADVKPDPIYITREGEFYGYAPPRQ